LTHRPSFAIAIGEEWRQMTGEGPPVWVPVFFPLVAGLYWSWFKYRIHKYAVAAIPPTVLQFLLPICHRGLDLPLVWGIESEWMKKHMYGYQ
jgi:hypothetical protein